MGVEEETVLTVARLMAVSARTAPKAKGMDSIEVKVAGPGELGSLAAAMKDMGERLGYSFFVRDAGNISASDGCLLVGVRGHEPVGINCGGCGYANCSAMTAALAGRGEVTAVLRAELRGEDGGPGHRGRLRGKDRSNAHRGQPGHVFGRGRGPLPRVAARLHGRVWPAPQGVGEKYFL